MLNVIDRANDKNWLVIKDMDTIMTLEEAKFVKAILRPILDLAPSQSSFKLDILSSNGVLKGVFTINSINGQFVSSSYDYRVYDLIKKLKNVVLKDLEDWKNTRFMDEAV